MQNFFWIIVAVGVIFSAIMLAIDYSNSQRDQKSKDVLLWGYGIIVAGVFLACWGLNAIPPVLVYSVFVLALVFFGRYLIRLAANRKK
jgi:hypothetical protein